MGVHEDLAVRRACERNRNRVSVCNSDPAVVTLCDRWIRLFASRPPSYSLQFHADQSVEGLRTFWEGELGVARDRIRLQRKSNSNELTGRSWRSRYGVLTVMVDDTLFHARLTAWMDCLRRSWG